MDDILIQKLDEVERHLITILVGQVIQLKSLFNEQFYEINNQQEIDIEKVRAMSKEEKLEISIQMVTEIIELGSAAKSKVKRSVSSHSEGNDELSEKFVDEFLQKRGRINAT